MVVNKRHRSQSSITPAPTCRRENLVTMSERILRMRQELYLALKASGVHWDHMLKQRGMFSYTGLTGLVNPFDSGETGCIVILRPVAQVEYLISRYHIYLMKSGRISLCGLNSANIQYFVDAVKDALAVHPERD